MKLKLETIEPKLRERIERQMRQEDAVKGGDVRNDWYVHPPEPAIEPKAPKRLRQKEGDGMNKLEREFYEKIKRDPMVSKVYPQALKFKLCNGVTYSPDFLIVQLAGHMICYETKGFMRDDAAIKIKMAAKEYPSFSWVLTWKKKGMWFEQRILP